MTNVTLKRCIMGAFGIGPNQIFGGSGWLDSNHYEIVAKAEQPVDDDGVLTIYQAFLAAFSQSSLTTSTKVWIAETYEPEENHLFIYCMLADQALDGPD